MWGAADISIDFKFEAVLLGRDKNSTDRTQLESTITLNASSLLEELPMELSNIYDIYLLAC
jgi:hypothetical protein